METTNATDDQPAHKEKEKPAIIGPKSLSVELISGKAREYGSTDNDLLKPVKSKSAEINKSAQELIATINDKRKRDTTMLAEYKTSLEKRTEAWFSRIETLMFKKYEKTNKLIEERMLKLFQVLDRLGQLETDLVGFRSSMSVFNSDMHKHATHDD